MDKNIKWIMIQPLTGGMYFGARNAIGHDAECIISYPGLLDIKHDKSGNVSSAGNEVGLIKWLKNHDAMIPYYTFGHKMFEYVNPENVKLTLTDYSGEYAAETPNFSDIDIVCAVPVCSGLSQATIASNETKQQKNNNMLFIANYVLSIIKPKVYIFENAPTLFNGVSSKLVRDTLENIAEKYGYSIVYYKTDTRFHDNCQRRNRTFVYFIKNDENHSTAPIMHGEQIRTTIEEYMSRIPDWATQQECVQMKKDNIVQIDYLKHKFGEDFRDKIKPWTIDNIIDFCLWDDFEEYVKTHVTDTVLRDKIIDMFDHIMYKLDLGKNFYALAPFFTKATDDSIGTCMFKTIPTAMHFKEDRLYTIREWLHMMGMPHDYELAGDINVNYPKIGQNVPARTAQWIITEAIRIVNNVDVEYTDNNVGRYNNTKIAKNE